MYVCMHACMYVCMNECMYFVCMNICMYVCMYVCMHVYMYIYIFSIHSQISLTASVRNKIMCASYEHRGYHNLQELGIKLHSHV